MIVNDLNVPGFAIAPHKTDPPLIVNANAVLTLAVAWRRAGSSRRRSPRARGRIRTVAFLKSETTVSPDVATVGVNFFQHDTSDDQAHSLRCIRPLATSFLDGLLQWPGHRLTLPVP